MGFEELIEEYNIEKYSNEYKILNLMYEKGEEGITSRECVQALGIPNLNGKYIPELERKGIKIYRERNHITFEWKFWLLKGIENEEGTINR